MFQHFLLKNDIDRNFFNQYIYHIQPFIIAINKYSEDSALNAMKDELNKEDLKRVLNNLDLKKI